MSSTRKPTGTAAGVHKSFVAKTKSYNSNIDSSLNTSNISSISSTSEVSSVSNLSSIRSVASSANSSSKLNLNQTRLDSTLGEKNLSRTNKSSFENSNNYGKTSTSEDLIKKIEVIIER